MHRDFDDSRGNRYADAHAPLQATATSDSTSHTPNRSDDAFVHHVAGYEGDL